MNTQEKIKQERLRAFDLVITAYNLTRTVLGVPGAMDYSKQTEGQGAQYKRTDPFKYLDFVIDVETVIKRNVSEEEYNIFKKHVEDEELNNTVISEALVAYKAKIGAAFIGNGLYPVADYFIPSTAKNSRQHYHVSLLKANAATVGARQ